MKQHLLIEICILPCFGARLLLGDALLPDFILSDGITLGEVTLLVVVGPSRRLGGHGLLGDTCLVELTRFGTRRNRKPIAS